MSSDPIITVENLEKSYRLYSQPLDRVREALSFRRHSFHTKFHALKGISFEIEKGETVGLIGPNGSGKSTLLEILCGTLTPSQGMVKVAGTIGGLLELGAGFNPEFTGRENVYLNATIFGLSKKVIDSKIDGIEEFASIGEFIDRPVRTYSSGMYVRLAFAAMIGVDPDILVIDEALAVGDVRFQRKCYRHFQKLQDNGSTILFVSHAVELIRSHCSRAIHLDKGNIISLGPPKAVVQSYLESMFLDAASTTKGETAGDGPIIRSADAKHDELGTSIYNPFEHRWGDGRARIVDFSIVANGVERPSVFPRGALVELRMQVEFHKSLDRIIYGFTLKTLEGVTVFGANTRSRHQLIQARTEGDVGEVKFRFRLNVLAGEYFVSLGVAVDDEHSDQIAVDRRYDMLHLKVTGGPEDFGLAEFAMNISEVS